MASRRGPDNTARVSIAGTCLGTNWANVFHVLLSTGSTITQADLDSWLSSFQAQYKTSFAPNVPTNTTYVAATAILYAPGGGQLTSNVTMSGTGGGGAQGQDNAACGIISWNSSVYWRGGKPRTYLPGLPSTLSTDGRHLTGAAITAYQSEGAGFITAINALTHGTITATQLGFISFFSGNVLRSPPVFFAITGAKVHPRLGTQRRRLGKWTQ